MNVGSSNPNYKHGLSKHPLHKTWRQIKARCYLTCQQNHRYYQGKGIKICEEWKNNFKNFYDWSINNGWQKGLSIDRKDSSKDYCPQNCRWIPLEKQSSNKSNNCYITAWGETKCRAEWLRDSRCKVSRTGLEKRLLKNIKPEIAMTYIGKIYK